MAIEIRPTGEAAATAAAGRTIGKAKAAAGELYYDTNDGNTVKMGV